MGFRYDTWQGALVRVENVGGFVELADRYQLVVTDPSSPWLLIEVEPQLGKLGPPSFSKQLSKDLNTSVIAFFLQTTVMNERVEHWVNGDLVRELEYHLDGGGWIAQSGDPQDWEPHYFFSDEEGTSDDEEWPSNLRDDISADDIVRYEQARSKKMRRPCHGSSHGGSISRLCRFHGVDPARPGAHQKSAPNWRVRVAVAVTIALLIGAVFLGAATSR